MSKKIGNMKSSESMSDYNSLVKETWFSLVHRVCLVSSTIWNQICWPNFQLWRHVWTRHAIGHWTGIWEWQHHTLMKELIQCENIASCLVLNWSLRKKYFHWVFEKCIEMLLCSIEMKTGADTAYSKCWHFNGNVLIDTERAHKNRKLNFIAIVANKRDIMENQWVSAINNWISDSLFMCFLQLEPRLSDTWISHEGTDQFSSNWISVHYYSLETSKLSMLLTYTARMQSSISLTYKLLFQNIISVETSSFIFEHSLSL